MDAQFQYIIKLAKDYHKYSENQDILFDELNALPKNVLEEVLIFYGNLERDFKPVNLLRVEVARRLLHDEKVDYELVEIIKEKIRKKDTGFFSHYSESFLKQINDYELYSRDLFANWQRPWSIFYSFFYRGIIKETVLSYLDQIASDLLTTLNLKEYTYHKVDFQGANNFGSTYCWLALYPITKESHKESYQFFVSFSSQPEAGQNAGWSIKSPSHNNLKQIHSYQDIIDFFQEIKPELIKLNQEIRNYFKFSPGSQASEWDNFYNENVVAIRFIDLPITDVSDCKSIEDINKMAGLTLSSKSNQTWNLWLLKSAKIGDLIFVNKGVNTCLGIGLITGNYYYDSNAGGCNHRCKVKWLTNKVYQYKPNTLDYPTGGKYKTLFRPDTFSPTKVHEFLLTEYVRLYPELITVFNKYNLLNKIDINNNNLVSAISVDIDPDEEINEPINYWWLNSNPKIWSISNHIEGQSQTYTTHNEKGNKRRIYKYFESAKKGDLIIGYESSPSKQIKAIYEVTKGIHKTEKEEEIEFQLIEKLEIPVHWNDLKNNLLLQNCEVFINNQGSLFKLTEEEYDIIREIIDVKNINTEISIYASDTKKKYKFSEDSDKPFISEKDFIQTVTLLKRKKNIILQGPPGVGKTFIARKIAYEIMQEEKDANIEMVQFHQSYSYEDFIQGLRPNLKGGFDIKEGVFYSFCQRALAHPERPFFFVIDEINRGNLSKIFGELMMLIEVDKRHEKFALKLTYAEDEEDRFYVPENLYIIGTMNTADRSLAIVDYALRRRFAFVSLNPDFGDNLKAFLSAKGLSNLMIEHVCKSVLKVNKMIMDDHNLGEGYQIGHSYFCIFNANENENTWWNDVILFELKPLLEEIWFDSKEKITEALKLLQR